jgi:hypothetical protein
VIHRKGTATITGSAKFLESYSESLKIAGLQPLVGQDEKGKGIVIEGSVKRLTSREQSQHSRAPVGTWSPSHNGWAKLNVDAGSAREPVRQASVL